MTAGTVHFALDEAILGPSDPAQQLIAWANDHLGDGAATFAGYRFHETLRMLQALPGGRHASALRRLAERDGRSIIDMAAQVRRGRFLSFVDACSAADIPTAMAAPHELFGAWCVGGLGPVADALGTDVTATWRLAMRHIAERSSLGARVNEAMEGHLTR